MLGYHEGISCGNMSDGKKRGYEGGRGKAKRKVRREEESELR